MEDKHSLDAEYFKKVYDAKDDPWDFETSDYEARKYAATLAALPKEHYKNALEIGCAIGVLTRLLAERCTRLLAIDVSQKALEQAKNRCRDLDNITFRQSSFAEGLPDQTFDLILVSEVAYYLSPADWEGAMEQLAAKMNPKAHLVLVHWLPEVHDYPQTGDEVHNRFAEYMHRRLKNVFNSRAENYRIDVWENSGTEQAATAD